MKIYLLILSFCATIFANSQNSYDFLTPLPPQSIVQNTVSPNLFGTYAGSTVDMDYLFSEKGVYVISTIYSSITRETVRESTKYKVKGDFLFGITGYDSIPCVLEGENYHFGIKFTDLIAGSGSKNKLTQISPTSYYINFEEKGHFTPSLLEFKGNELQISHFTYESDDAFKKLKTRTEKSTADMNYITLNPSIEEWAKFKTSAIFNVPRIYLKTK